MPPVGNIRFAKSLFAILFRVGIIATLFKASQTYICPHLQQEVINLPVLPQFVSKCLREGESAELPSCATVAWSSGQTVDVTIHIAPHTQPFELGIGLVLTRWRYESAGQVFFEGRAEVDHRHQSAVATDVELWCASKKLLRKGIATDQSPSLQVSNSRFIVPVSCSMWTNSLLARINTKLLHPPSEPITIRFSGLSVRQPFEIPHNSLMYTTPDPISVLMFVLCVVVGLKSAHVLDQCLAVFTKLQSLSTNPKPDLEAI